MKAKFLKVFADSRVDKLLKAEIDDMKPTQFFSYLRRLSSNTRSEVSFENISSRFG